METHVNVNDVTNKEATGKYSDYDIIPIGDHCAISMILKELNIRQRSYPFDWVTNKEQVHDTNIIYNMQLIHELTTSDNVDDIVKKYIGDAFTNNNKTNSINNIWFPHESTNLIETTEKYTRRFIRLKENVYKKNMFIFLTRHYYIEEDIFQGIIKQLLSYNRDSIILFISGTNHKYFENMQCDNVIFKHIEYDISKVYAYDYSTFRPSMKTFLKELFM
jgi:hypothetical protein